MRKHTFEGFLKAQEFLRHAAIVPVDSELADMAIELRRDNNIKLADALIAATALLNDLTLLPEMKTISRHLRNWRSMIR
jgi:predicted nucleic acid-binding protein